MTYQLKDLVAFQKQRVDFRKKNGNCDDRDILILQHLDNKFHKLQKGQELNIGFDEFWFKYDKKVDRVEAELLWHRLSDKEREDAMHHVILFVKANPDKEGRPSPARYLRRKKFTDEIINHKAFYEKKEPVKEVKTKWLTGQE